MGLRSGVLGLWGLLGHVRGLGRSRRRLLWLLGGAGFRHHLLGVGGLGSARGGGVAFFFRFLPAKVFEDSCPTRVGPGAGAAPGNAFLARPARKALGRPPGLEA